MATDPAAAIYNPATGTSIVLGASVSSLAGRVDATASVTFTVSNAAGPVGNPLTVDLVNGRATGSYALPSGLSYGSYAISTVFSGTSNFSGSGDRSAGLLLTGVASTILPSGGSTPQTAVVATAFHTAPQVTVEDQLGNPIAGALVTFAAPASGAGGSFVGGASTVTATTNAQGLATAPGFAAGTMAGTYAVVATVPGVSASASFTLTNAAGTASSIATSTGTAQSATVVTAFANPLQAVVKDQYNNTIAGATVTFVAPSGGAGGSFAGAKTAMATTNSLGLASTPPFTAGTASGGYVVHATAPGAAMSASFNLTNQVKTTTTLAAQPNPVAIGRPLTLTATVAVEALSAGSVSFFDGSKLLGTSKLDGSGHAALTTSSLGYGTHTLTAIYAGDAVDATSGSTPASARVGAATPGDFDGDGKTDVAIFDLTTTTYLVIDSGGGSMMPQIGIKNHKNLPV